MSSWHLHPSPSNHNGHGLTRDTYMVAVKVVFYGSFMICNFLYCRGRKSEAVDNLLKLRGKTNPESVESEMAGLELVVKKETGSGSQTWSQRFNALLTRTVLIPMVLLVFLFFTQSFSGELRTIVRLSIITCLVLGSNMVSYYTVTIFQMAEIPLDENVAAILVAAQYVVGYSISSVLVTRVPRRVLLIGSLILMMMANFAAGMVLLEKNVEDQNITANTTHYIDVTDGENELEEQEFDGYSLIPVLSCIFITFGYACGLGPVPFILFGELFPSKDID